MKTPEEILEPLFCLQMKPPNLDKWDNFYSRAVVIAVMKEYAEEIKKSARMVPMNDWVAQYDEYLKIEFGDKKQNNPE